MIRLIFKAYIEYLTCYALRNITIPSSVTNGRSIAARYAKMCHFVSISTKDLISNHVGDTAIKTSNEIKRALGGILLMKLMH